MVKVLTLLLLLGSFAPVAANPWGLGDLITDTVERVRERIANDGEIVVPDDSFGGVYAFDPIEDVPFMENWEGDIEGSGSGNCYAMNILTAYAFLKVDFTGEEGVNIAQWVLEGGRIGDRAPLQLDTEQALEFFFLWLGTSLENVEEKGRLKVAGFSSLRDMTRPGSKAEEHFREIAAAIQFAMQIPTAGPQYLGSILKDVLGILPGDVGGRDSVNSNSFRLIKESIQAGRPAPITLHDANANFAGHVLLAYEYQETADQVTIQLHDVNAPPASDEESLPAVLTFDKGDDWSYEVHNANGDRKYTYELVSVPDAENGGARRWYRAIAREPETYREWNGRLDAIFGEGNSLGERASGVVDSAGEAIRNPVNTFETFTGIDVPDINIGFSAPWN